MIAVVNERHQHLVAVRLQACRRILRRGRGVDSDLAEEGGRQAVEGNCPAADLLRQLVVELSEDSGANGPGMVTRRLIGGVTDLC
jgi:hypothetical protein